MNELYSNFYDREFSERELKNALYFYFEWCEENYCNPEVDKIEDINENNIDHILFHAKIKGMRI